MVALSRTTRKQKKKKKGHAATSVSGSCSGLDTTCDLVNLRSSQASCAGRRKAREAMEQASLQSCIDVTPPSWRLNGWKC